MEDAIGYNYYEGFDKHAKDHVVTIIRSLRDYANTHQP